ncbi:MAG: MmgE/PrpD family protein [Dehalococcoidia bacterium]|nr:MAG: MmgE/PrpD family protein [Dehalococcoidia bacterium]
MSEGENITGRYAGYIKNLKFSDLPVEVVSQAKKLILDTLGCTMGGSRTKIALMLLDYVRSHKGARESTIVGHKAMTLCRDAAFINAQMAHILDYDETYKMMGHPAGPTIYPAMAIGEVKKISGRDFIVAFVLGYDIASRIAAAIWPSEERRKQVWPFGTFHVFGSVSAVSKVLSLDKNQIENALGIAAANAPIPFTRRFVEKFCMIKNCEGWAASVGIDSALLARRGFSGLHKVLDGNTGFWVMAGSDTCNWELMVDKLGEEFEIMKGSIKLYPIYQEVQSTLDVFHAMVREERLSVKDIKKCTIRSCSDICGNINQDSYRISARPKTMEEAWANIKWGIAMISLGIDRGPAWFTDELFNSRKVLNMMEKIKLQTDPEADKYFPEKIVSMVEIITMKGDRYTNRVETADGVPQNPLSWDEVRQKFEELASPVIGREKSKGVVIGVEKLERQSDIRNLTSLLRAGK